MVGSGLHRESELLRKVVVPVLFLGDDLSGSPRMSVSGRCPLANDQAIS